MRHFNILFPFASIVVALLFLPDQSLGSKLKEGPLTTEENVEFLKELMNSKKEKGDLLIPKSSKAQESLRLKLKKLKKWADSECESFLLDPIEKLPSGEISDCSEELEFTFDKICDTEVQKEFLECVLPPVQTYAHTLFRCYATIDPEFKWDKPGKTMLSTQHGVLKTIPKLINLILEIFCEDKEIVTSSIAMKDELTKLMTQWQIEIEKSEGKLLQGMGLCWLKNNEIKRGWTLCEHYAKFNYESIVGCFLELKQFEDVKSQVFWKLVIWGFDQIAKKEGNPLQTKFQDTLWEEFCAEESQLFFLFNEMIVNPVKKDEL